jgi:hypothetical protein
MQSRSATRHSGRSELRRLMWTGLKGPSKDIAVHHNPKMLGSTNVVPCSSVHKCEFSYWITISPLKSHRFSVPHNSVSMKTLFKLFINRVYHDDSFVEVMVFGYDPLCDLLEILNLINIGSAVATRRNLVDPIQRTNMRGLMAERFRAFESRWILFVHFIFFHLFLIIFMYIFFRRIFQYYPLSFQLIFFKFQNRLIQCLALVMLLVPRVDMLSTFAV